MKKFRVIQFTCVDELNVDSPNYRKQSINLLYNQFLNKEKKKMSNKEYPLHPGQTQASPDYVQVPQSEYESLKRENKQLHALLHGANRQESNAEIDTLASECRALREMNAKAQEEIATLKENQRWRKYSEEKPQDGQEVWAYDSSQKLVIKLEYQVREDCEGFVGFPLIHGFWPCITYWMPYNKPKSPEGK